MTDAQKHAARLREEAIQLIGAANECNKSAAVEENIAHRTKIIRASRNLTDRAASLLAGAEALEAQGEWRIRNLHTSTYLIPGDRSKDWADWLLEREVGEPSAIVPEWAVPVLDDVIVTGWRR